VFLAAASQRTKNIRLGHGITLTPPPYNHPARLAERLATLDIVSRGRVE
jgi:alkanesulfonate monooxygenase SsuD/methylene tetrahydromethanopterin reductase-like flavin-dependent oxidoreductase (luciferase family)